MNKPGKYYIEPDSPNIDRLKAQKTSQVASGVRPPSSNRTYTQGENYSNSRTNIYPSINNSTSGKHRGPPAEGCGLDRRLHVNVQQLDRTKQKIEMLLYIVMSQGMSLMGDLPVILDFITAEILLSTKKR